MEKITLDAAAAAALRAAETGTELIGPDGHPIGAFVRRDALSAVRQVLSERRRLLDEEIDAISTAELDAIVAAGGGIPHDEVVKRLGLE